MSALCAECEKNGRSCCINTQICLTMGDIERISRFVDNTDFLVWEPPEPEYLNADENDPNWSVLTIRKDGMRRTMKRKQEKKCLMLTSSGCKLPLEVRPLICRLHPYVYTERGIRGICKECPIFFLPNRPSILDSIGMSPTDVSKWCQMLYAELWENAELQNGCGVGNSPRLPG